MESIWMGIAPGKTTTRALAMGNCQPRTVLTKGA